MFSKESSIKRELQNLDYSQNSNVSKDIYSSDILTDESYSIPLTEDSELHHNTSEDSKTNSELSFKKQKDTLILKNPSSEDKILLKSTAKDNKTSLLSSSSHLKLEKKEVCKSIKNSPPKIFLNLPNPQISDKLKDKTSKDDICSVITKTRKKGIGLCIDIEEANKVPEQIIQSKSKHGKPPQSTLFTKNPEVRDDVSPGYEISATSVLIKQFEELQERNRALVRENENLKKLNLTLNQSLNYEIQTSQIATQTITPPDPEFERSNLEIIQLRKEKEILSKEVSILRRKFRSGKDDLGATRRREIYKRVETGFSVNSLDLSDFPDQGVLKEKWKAYQSQIKNLRTPDYNLQDNRLENSASSSKRSGSYSRISKNTPKINNFTRTVIKSNTNSVSVKNQEKGLPPKCPINSDLHPTQTLSSFLAQLRQSFEDSKERAPPQIFNCGHKRTCSLNQEGDQIIYPQSINYSSYNAQTPKNCGKVFNFSTALVKDEWKSSTQPAKKKNSLINIINSNTKELFESRLNNSRRKKRRTLECLLKEDYKASINNESQTLYPQSTKIAGLPYNNTLGSLGSRTADRTFARKIGTSSYLNPKYQRNLKLRHYEYN